MHVGKSHCYNKHLKLPNLPFASFPPLESAQLPKWVSSPSSLVVTIIFNLHLYIVGTTLMVTSFTKMVSWYCISCEPMPLKLFLLSFTSGQSSLSLPPNTWSSLSHLICEACFPSHFIFVLHQLVWEPCFDLVLVWVLSPAQKATFFVWWHRLIAIGLYGSSSMTWFFCIDSPPLSHPITPSLPHSWVSSAPQPNSRNHRWLHPLGLHGPPLSPLSKSFSTPTGKSCYTTLLLKLPSLPSLGFFTRRAPCTST